MPQLGARMPLGHTACRSPFHTHARVVADVVATFICVSFLQHVDFKMVGIRVEVFRVYDIDVAKSQFHCDFEIFLVGAP